MRKKGSGLKELRKEKAAFSVMRALFEDRCVRASLLMLSKCT